MIFLIIKNVISTIITFDIHSCIFVTLKKMENNTTINDSMFNRISAFINIY